MLIVCDASQLEWRVILELANETVGIEEILNGEDTHEKNRLQFNLPTRLISKIFLFRTIFRGTGWGFANDPDFMHVSTSPKFWDQRNEDFYGKYSAIDHQHHLWSQLVVQGKPIVGPLGCEWDIPMSPHPKTGELKIPWQSLTNFPVQGTAANVMSIARVSFAKRWASSGMEGKLRSTVHDNIVLDAPAKNLEIVSQMFLQVFKDIPKNIKKNFNYDWKVPLDCEIKYGPSMKDMTKFKA